MSFVAGQPELLVGAHGGAAELGHHLGQYLPDVFGGVALGDLQQCLRGDWQKAVPARTGG